MTAGSFKLFGFLQQPVPEAPPKSASFPIGLSCQRKSAQFSSPEVLMSEKATGGRKKGKQHSRKANRLAHIERVYVPTKGFRME